MDMWWVVVVLVVAVVEVRYQVGHWCCRVVFDPYGYNTLRDVLQGINHNPILCLHHQHVTNNSPTIHRQYMQTFIKTTYPVLILVTN